MPLLQVSCLQLWMRAGEPARALGRCMASALDGLSACSTSASTAAISSDCKTSASQSAGSQHGAAAYQHGVQHGMQSGMGMPCSTGTATFTSIRQLTSLLPPMSSCQYATAASAGGARKRRAGSQDASPQPGPSPSPSTPTSQSTEPSQPALASIDGAISTLDMEALMKALVTPLPLGSQRNARLHHAIVELNGVFFPDPAKTLQSVMRTLFVMQQVLRGDGHVGIISPNPLFKPLVKEAALHCTNPNLWWGWEAEDGGQGGIMSGRIMSPAHQPMRKLLGSRGLTMVNGHSSAALASTPSVSTVMQAPKPRLDEVDKWRLFSRRGGRSRGGVRPRDLLRSVVDAETRAARIPLPGAPRDAAKRSLQLLIVLDTSMSQEVLQEAASAGVLTCAVVDAHSTLDNITYPIYANGAHPAFVHFMLDWVLKVANMPPVSTTPDISK